MTNLPKLELSRKHLPFLIAMVTNTYIFIETLTRCCVVRQLKKRISSLIYSMRTKVFVHLQISMYRLCHLSTKESVGNQDGNRNMHGSKVHCVSINFGENI